MGRLIFLFGNHDHQPIGNFDHVFEEAYRKSYRPFLDVLERHPGVQWNLHATGILWEWIERNHPDFHERVRAMVGSQQLEILSGGYYEPILAVLPDRDKVGQIRKLNRYIEDRFGGSPNGMWCAERIWEPHLPQPIQEAGIGYTLLDDTHFLSAGIEEEGLFGYYRVEEQDSAVDIFPISHELRFLIPFHPVERVMEALRRLRPEGDAVRAVVMVDDGEKFGLWPDTYKQVYEKGWLEDFLKELEKNRDWITTATFSAYRAQFPPLGKAFLPTASYFEMSQWALPAPSQIELDGFLARMQLSPTQPILRKFVKGGFWRNFLSKYPESNSMYKKMMRISRRARDAEGRTSKKGEAALAAARDRLWAGQCNCSYWHGVFGGLYLPVLRHAIYRHLIESEILLDGLEKPEARGRVESCDFEGTGRECWLVETPAQDLYFSASQGGSLFEWDFKPARVNVANVLTRRPEAYHRRIRSAKPGAAQADATRVQSIHELLASKEEGLDRRVVHDWYRRSSMLDHFLHPSTTPEQFFHSRYGEQGDFVLGAFHAERSLAAPAPKKRGKGPADPSPPPLSNPFLWDARSPMELRFHRRGIVWDREQKREVRLEKTVRVAPGGEERCELEVRVRLSNLSKEALDLWYGSEWNFAFSVSDPDQDAPFSGQDRWTRTDPHHHWRIAARFSHPTEGWLAPLETVSSSEGGFERTTQGVCALFHWPCALLPDGHFERVLHYTLEKI